MMSRYAELQVTSHFSFLRGASSCEELFEQAKTLGIEALAIVDRHSLAGIVRAHQAAKDTGVRLIIGCRVDLTCGMAVLLYPTDRAAYGRLCRLLSLGKTKGGKGKCQLEWADLAAYAEGLLAVLVPDLADDACAFRLRRLKEVFADRVYLALTLRRRPNDQLRLFELTALAETARVPTLVTNDVLFHAPERRILQDVVTCIRHNVTIDNAGFRRERHADRYLKPPAEMYRLFSRNTDAVARTQQFTARCRFSLDELIYQYPEERQFPDLTPQQALEKLTWEGAKNRYPNGISDTVRRTLEHELRLIAQLDYAPYFLTVNSIVQFARSKNILCQGRGSAANSTVCYVLGITSIDPVHSDLLFERFISVERREPPDIDVDFEHQRREEVIQWIYGRYGRTRSALCAVVTRYRSKGALRDVGKALGLPEDLTKTLSSRVWGWSDTVSEKHVKDLNLNLQDRRLRLTLELAQQLIGAPRHLSQHPGGFVLTRDRLDELVPIEPAAMEDRQVIEWDKDDIDILKFMKVDVLGLGMLSCMRRCFEMIEKYKGEPHDLATIPQEDPQTYAMISKADTIGVFQIESRAQMSMLPRMKPQTFYDLVIEVAIVRPGPIQGDMVHPYLRRREGKEKVEYPKPELYNVLHKTLGVPLFQEQAMRVAIECGGFTPGEADQLRRSMATFKHTGGVSKFGEKLISGMVKNGYEREFAERTFRQLEGFGSYGFPESHAASFALIAYASSWVKCHHPDVFCASLLNSQPMGFYAAAQIVRDAEAHGVTVLPVCINASRWDCTLEREARGEGDATNGFLAVRLGLRMVKGLSNAEAALLVANRGEGQFSSVDDVWQRAGVSAQTLVSLAEADAMRPSLKLARRDALWTIKAFSDAPLPLFAAAAKTGSLVEQVEPEVSLRPMTAGSEVVQDYGHVGLTLREHPLSFLREDLNRKGMLTCRDAFSKPDRTRATVAGMVLVRQRPGSARGVIFMTIEDETGVANLVVWKKMFEKYRPVVMGAAMVGARGYIQREGEVVHLVVQHIDDLSRQLGSVGARDKPFPLPHGRGDEFHHGIPPVDPRTVAKSPLPNTPPFAASKSEIPPPRTVADPYEHLDQIRVRSRDFH